MTIAANEPESAGARHPVERALRWWVGELRGCWRDVARRFVGGRNAVVIEAGERYWMVRQRRRLLGQIDCTGADAAERRRSLRRLASGRSGAVAVEIPPERLLEKRIRLPASAQREVARIVPFEIGRHFPFPAERVYFRHRVTGRDSGGIEVEIVAVPRTVVAEICGELTAAGLRVTDIAAAGSSGPAVPMPVAVPTRRPALTRGQAWLVALFAVLGLAALAAPVIHDRLRLAAVSREGAMLRPRVELRVAARAREMQAAARIAGALRVVAARPPLVAVLDKLTRAIPDGSWLTTLTTNGRAVVMSGLSPSAAAVALALEHRGTFTDIAFRTPIVRDPATGLEHFEIAASVGGPLP